MNPVKNAERLIAIATDGAASPVEAVRAAIRAVQLIRRHGLRLRLPGVDHEALYWAKVREAEDLQRQLAELQG